MLSSGVSARSGAVEVDTDDYDPSIISLTPVSHQGHDAPSHVQQLSRPASCFTSRIVTGVESHSRSFSSAGNSTATVPNFSTPTIRRHERPVASIDAASPTKLRSPLRQSVSYSDSPITYLPEVNSESAEELAWPITGSPTMPYTGDSRPRASPGSSPASRMPPRTALRSSPSAEGLSAPTVGSSDVTPARLPTAHPDGVSPSPTAVSPGGSRFSLFTSSISRIKGFTSTTAPQPPPDDNLLDLEIESALFPAGLPSDRDAFSPASFKNLQMTATGLLHRFQSAYQYRTAELRVVQAEREAQSDEKEEAETRMRHLKMQLEGMAQKAAEHEAAMRSLMEELSREKKMRMEERASMAHGNVLLEGSTVSEDLGVEDDQQRKKWRVSVGTAKSELSFETDEESMEGASVFSRSRSPTIATSVSEVSYSPVETPLPQGKLVLFGPPGPQRPPPRPSLPQMTAFQRLFQGSTSESRTKDDASGPSSCRNCEGQEARAAWDTVDLLKSENKGLKERVGELEAGVDMALDVVRGIGL